jgi:hypothetical protein
MAAAIVALSITLVVVMGVLVVGLWFSSNSAEVTVTPIAGKVTSVGGRKICDTGDGGHTGLNNAPWYMVFYSVPDKSSALVVALRAAAAAGYPLRAEKPDSNPATYVYDSNPPSDD